MFIKISFIYNKTFNPDFTIFDLFKLKKDSRPFVELINNHIKNILNAIEYNNEPWKREYIPIYIISGKIKSFSDPLTIKYRDNPKLLLLILIHELIHNNLTKKYKNSSDVHKAVDKIYRKVIKDLDLSDFEKAEEEYNTFL